MSDAPFVDELAELAASARALVEWYGETGMLGLDAEPGTLAVLDGARPVAPTKPAAAAVAARAPAAPVAASAPAPSAIAPAVAQAPAASRPAPSAGPPRAQPTFAEPRVPISEARAPIAAPIAAPIEAPVSDDERRTRLALLSEQVRGCEKCGLCKTRNQTVFARGSAFAEVCFVGEGPGQDEDEQGLPFVGKAGQLLDRMIAAMGYARDEVYICNVVKCRPPENRKPEPNEMEACAPYLREQLALVKPKVIVALGATAVTALMGSTEGITRMRGKWKLYKGTPIMPTFHPAYLLRQPAAKREVWEDLQAVMRHVGKAPQDKR